MASDEVVSRRRPARNGDKGVVDLAGDVLKEVATLLQTELNLLVRRFWKSSPLPHCPPR